MYTELCFGYPDARACDHESLFWRLMMQDLHFELHLFYILIIFRLTGLMVVYFKSSLENKITNLKSCQKKVAISDESLTCSDCMCFATDGFSSKEFLDIIVNQKKAEEEYGKLKDQLSTYKKKVMNLENYIYITELLNKNWDEKKDILTEEFQKNEMSFRNLLFTEVKEEIRIKSQNIQSQLDQQSGEITNIKGTGAPAIHMYYGFINIYTGIDFVE